MADRLPLTADATTELPHPVKLTTRTSNEKLAVAPAAIAGPVQVAPELPVLHDHDDVPFRPVSEIPAGKVTLAVTGPVPPVPGSATLTETRAVTPRSRTLFT